MIQYDEIKFSDQSHNYCVCIIDIVNSTLVTARVIPVKGILSDEKEDRIVTD